VVGLTAGSLTVLSSDRYLHLLEESSVGLRTQVTMLIRMLRDADERIADAANCDLDERVSRQLGRLCGSQPFPVELPITQTDLATMIGASRASVARSLGALRSAGALSTERGRIIVNEPFSR
jgi:CRP-like cAMP-binding protein